MDSSEAFYCHYCNEDVEPHECPFCCEDSGCLTGLYEDVLPLEISSEQND